MAQPNKGVYERHFERKAHAIPEHLKRSTEKFYEANSDINPEQPVRGPSPRSYSDHEGHLLEKGSAANQPRKLTADAVSMVRSLKTSRNTGGYHKPGMLAMNEKSERGSSQECWEARKYSRAGASSLSQGGINRLALQHRETDSLPLNTSNLELLASQQHYLGQPNNKHGGSAALLHASRARGGPPGALAYASFDTQGNPSTESFRPRRTSARKPYLLEVLEEPGQQESRQRQHIRSDSKQVKKNWEEKDKHPVRQQHEAVEVGRTERRKIYKIR